MPTRPGLLDCIERYFAAAPLGDARIEAVGGLDVPIGDPAWPYPARPRPGGGPVTADDVRTATARQTAAGLPAALEWVPERSPTTAAAARAAGLTVEELPLLVAVDQVDLLLPAGVRLYVVGADDPELPYYQRVAATAFATPGEWPTTTPTRSTWPRWTPPRRRRPGPPPSGSGSPPAGR
ncbi:hypothetical protein [Blastococcus sp. PRF04-17]|uniref:hypothetical protein n=1 Tax=Blastococcus sp. PRF04-17 TaxID=2933797 RepID=UPI001FF3F883|nr:hypothetical protein [Blastococcus sp. PRF04-17]UOY02553.1 hypothetical protein MVA48_04020 [Blastococcus sp. PRF04-17]